MDAQKKSDGAEGQKKNLPPQVEQMLASAKEMETILTHKLTKIDAVSLEKSEMAKQEALKIKADVEEIKRLSLIQTKEGEEALKAKIMEVNQRIETTTRKAAELQKQLVEFHKELFSELSGKAPDVRNSLLTISELPEKEKQVFLWEVSGMIAQAKERLEEVKADMKKIVELEKKMIDVRAETYMSREELINKLHQQLALIINESPKKAKSESPSYIDLKKPRADLTGASSRSFREPQKGKKSDSPILASSDQIKSDVRGSLRSIQEPSKKRKSEFGKQPKHSAATLTVPSTLEYPKKRETDVPKSIEASSTTRNMHDPLKGRRSESPKCTPVQQKCSAALANASGAHEASKDRKDLPESNSPDKRKSDSGGSISSHRTRESPGKSRTESPSYIDRL